MWELSGLAGISPFRFLIFPNCFDDRPKPPSTKEGSWRRLRKLTYLPPPDRSARIARPLPAPSRHLRAMPRRTRHRPTPRRAAAATRLCSRSSCTERASPIPSRSRTAAPRIVAARFGACFATASSATPSSACVAASGCVTTPAIVRLSTSLASADSRLPSLHSARPLLRSA